MSVTEVAISKIKARIVSGDLTPGTKLPREADLAADLGVSRNSLREAVRALELIRVLDVRQGDGTYVASLSPASMLEAMTFLIDIHHDESVFEIFGLRRILEPAATALAATTIAEADLAELATLAAYRPTGDDVGDLVQHDLMFHSAIAAGSGNHMLASLLDSISQPTVRARMWRGISDENAIGRTVTEHLDIYAAIAARDPELARARALSHVAGVEQWLHRAHQ